jgi:NADH-quinone oxidoreductase subunit L
MTHAFFKALLFLAAGVVVLSLHHEQDLFRMGGLRRDLPLVFWSMLIGAGSLAGVPLITAGSFSKDRILWEVWSSPIGGPWLWGAGLIGVGLTALYSFRLIFLAFFGERQTVPAPKGGAALGLPLIVLAVLSIGAGWMGWPEIAGPVHEEHGSTPQELLMEGIVGAVALAGIALAYLLFVYRPRVVEALITTEPVEKVRTVLARGPLNLVYDRLVVRPFLWAARSTRTDPFDRAYERLIAQPFVRFAERNQQDLVNRLYDAVVRTSEWMHEGLHRQQTGSVRWYAAVLAGGSILLIGWVLMAGMMG